MSVTTKHFGRDKRNGNRLIIISPFIVGDPNSNIQPNFHKALVVEIDSLPGSVQDPLVGLVESERVQDADDLLNVLTDARFPNNQNVIKHLAENKWMYPVDINYVEVTPNRFTNLPLIDWMRKNLTVERYRAKMKERYDFTIVGYSHITGETVIDGEAQAAQPQIKTNELFATVDEKLPDAPKPKSSISPEMEMIMQHNMAMMQQMSKMTEALEKISNAGEKKVTKPRGRPKNAQKA